MKPTPLFRSTALVLMSAFAVFGLEACNQSPAPQNTATATADNSVAAGAPMADGSVPAAAQGGSAQGGGSYAGGSQGGQGGYASNAPQGGGYTGGGYQGGGDQSAPSQGAAYQGGAPDGGYADDASSGDDSQMAYADTPPPPLPVYDQPPIPAYGYIWTPGAFYFSGGQRLWRAGYWALPVHGGHFGARFRR